MADSNQQVSAAMGGQLLVKPHDLPGGGKLWWAIIAAFFIIWIFGAFVFHGAWQHIEEKHSPAHAPSSAPIHVPPHGPWDSLYRSVQLFHMHDTHWPELEDIDSKGDVIAVIVTRSAAAAFALGVPIVFLGLLFSRNIREFIYSWSPRHPILVCGDSPGSDEFVETLKREGKRVVRILPKRSHESHHELEPILTLSGKVSESKFWIKTAQAKKAQAIVLMETSDAENIRKSLVLQKALAGVGEHGKIKCHVHLVDLHLRKGLRRLLPLSNTSGSLFTTYFNRYEIMARLLAHKHPLPTAVVAENDVQRTHYIIVGFGQFGQNIALKLVKMGQQIVRIPSSPDPIFKARPPKITIVDRQGKSAIADFLHSHDGFEQTCDLQPAVQADCGDDKFLDLDFEGLMPTDQVSIIYCLEDEAVVVGSILRFLDKPSSVRKKAETIFFRTAEEGGVGDLVLVPRSEWHDGPSIHRFALDSQVFRPDVVLNLSLDTMAQAIHDSYRDVAKLESDPMNPAPIKNKVWMDLNDEEREGNREPADHMWAKLRHLGYAVEPASAANKNDNGSANEKLIAAIAKNIEDLASSEHYRWMAWRLVNGWRWGKERNPDEKLHPDIKAYEKLSPASKEKDRAVVNLIPKLLNLGQLQVRVIGS